MEYIIIGITMFFLTIITYAIGVKKGTMIALKSTSKILDETINDLKKFNHEMKNFKQSKKDE